jgi:hypothetical protein
MNSNIFNEPDKNVLKRKESGKSVILSKESEANPPKTMPKTPKAEQKKIEKYKTASAFDWQKLNTEIAFNQTAKKGDQ